MPSQIAEKSAEDLDRRARTGTLVLGLGNTVLSDDGVGVHVVRALESEASVGGNVVLQDGGTVGLGLLPEISRSDALIVVDAAELGARPGTLRVFEGAEMDARVGKTKGSVHEIALYDLMSAAALSGTRPGRRALVAIQPAHLGWGTEPTADVAATIPAACEAVARLIETWTC